jgi:hypothetical protein
MFAGTATRVEAATPAPWIFVRRNADADRDRAGVDIDVRGIGGGCCPPLPLEKPPRIEQSGKSGSGVKFCR